MFGGFAESVSRPESGPGTYRLAGWWSRVGAALLDGLIIGVGGLLLLALVGAVFSVGFFASDTAGIISVIVGLMLAFGAFAVIALLYAPLMMARTDGQTLGRMAMGIRVIRASGEPMTFGWAMLREVVIKCAAVRRRGRVDHARPRRSRRRAVAALGRGEPRAPRLHRRTRVVKA